MSFFIYGLRVKGDKEVRYVGQTADIEKRLAGHMATASNMPWATDFAEWMLDNRLAVEIVPLRVVETRDEARRAERETIGFFLALDHRLFNQWLVPADKRVPPRTKPYNPRWRRRAA